MKTIIITGATSGIGYETAKSLCSLGHNLVIIARDSANSRQVFQELQAINPQAKLSLELCDLADLKQVKALATRLLKLPRIDVLINNAGLEMATRHESPQGFELTWAVNYLAPFLLTRLLLPKLLENPGARIVNTSSLVEKWGKLDFADLQIQVGYDPEKAYYRSKLALLISAYELARHYSAEQLTINSFEPGMTKTNFSRDFQGIMKYGAMFMRLFMHGPEVPAKTAVFLAVDETVSKLTGACFLNLKAIKTSPQSYDQALAKKLWDETEQELATFLA